MKGPVYWHPWLYRRVMTRLYGQIGYEERYRVVAKEVPPDCDVVDLCAGDGRLRHYLPGSVRYTAVDMNEGFLRDLQRQGVATVAANLRQTIPPGACVVMMAALYHFMPNHIALVRRAIEAASDRFILTEPVENVTSAGGSLRARIGAWASDPGDGSGGQRLCAADLEQLLRDVPGGRIAHRAREWVMVWDKRPTSQTQRATATPSAR